MVCGNFGHLFLCSSGYNLAVPLENPWVPPDEIDPRFDGQVLGLPLRVGPKCLANAFLHHRLHRAAVVHEIGLKRSFAGRPGGALTSSGVPEMAFFGSLVILTHRQDLYLLSAKPPLEA